MVVTSESLAYILCYTICGPIINRPCIKLFDDDGGIDDDDVVDDDDDENNARNVRENPSQVNL